MFDNNDEEIKQLRNIGENTWGGKRERESPQIVNRYALQLASDSIRKDNIVVSDSCCPLVCIRMSRKTSRRRRRSPPLNDANHNMLKPVNFACSFIAQARQTNALSRCDHYSFSHAHEDGDRWIYIHVDKRSCVCFSHVNLDLLAKMVQ